MRHARRLSLSEVQYTLDLVIRAQRNSAFDVLGSGLSPACLHAFTASRFTSHTSEVRYVEPGGPVSSVSNSALSSQEGPLLSETRFPMLAADAVAQGIAKDYKTYCAYIEQLRLALGRPAPEVSGSPGHRRKGSLHRGQGELAACQRAPLFTRAPMLIAHGLCRDAGVT